MEDHLYWDSVDISNPGSRRWKKRFARWVQVVYPNLGVYAVVGKLPRPMCLVFPRDFAALVEGWQKGHAETSRGEKVGSLLLEGQVCGIRWLWPTRVDMGRRFAPR